MNHLPKFSIRDLVWLTLVVALIVDRSIELGAADRRTRDATRRADTSSKEARYWQSVIDLRDSQFELHDLLAELNVDGSQGRLRELPDHQIAQIQSIAAEHSKLQQAVRWEHWRPKTLDVGEFTLYVDLGRVQ